MKKLACLLFILWAQPALAQTTMCWDPSVGATSYRVYTGATLAGTTSNTWFVLPGTIASGVSVSGVDANGHEGARAIAVSSSVSCPGAPAVPPPQVPGTSANGTTTTISGAAIVDAGGHLWTLRSDHATLRDGTYIGSGYAELLLWWNATIYAQAGTSWFQWTGTAWSFMGGSDPRGSLPPPPAAISVVTGCSVELTATVANQPDATSGWRAQFRVDGVNVGTYDATATYGPRTKALKPGSHTVDIVWSKSSTTVPTVTSKAGTVTCP